MNTFLSSAILRNRSLWLRNDYIDLHHKKDFLVTSQKSYWKWLLDSCTFVSFWRYWKRNFILKAIGLSHFLMFCRDKKLVLKLFCSSEYKLDSVVLSYHFCCFCNKLSKFSKFFLEWSLFGVARCKRFIIRCLFPSKSRNTKLYPLILFTSFVYCSAPSRRLLSSSSIQF